MKPLQWHPLARSDADEAAAWYSQEGGVALELAFTDALESAVQRISRQPGIGSARQAEMLKIPALRHWPTNKFPHLVYYIEREAQLDIWRVLHAKRDVPAWIGQPDDQAKSSRK